MESLGTYARSPSPEPPISREKILFRALAIKQITPFPSFLGKFLPWLRPQNGPFPEKMGTRMRPPYAFGWGGGGGADRTYLYLHEIGCMSTDAVFFTFIAGISRGPKVYAQLQIEAYIYRYISRKINAYWTCYPSCLYARNKIDQKSFSTWTACPHGHGSHGGWTMTAERTSFKASALHGLSQAWRENYQQ